MRDVTQFKERFQRWKKTGELPYEAGRIKNADSDREELVYEDSLSLSALPAYEEGKDDYGEQYTDYGIPFIQSKRLRLTNAGLATGAVLSENMLDSIADNAVKVGLPIKTALGLAVKESTLGNPTDDRTAWNMSSGIRDMFNGIYPGTYQHINEYGHPVSSRELINMWKDQGDRRYGKKGVSVLLGGFEFYKNYPNRYNPRQKNYLKLVDKRGDEVWGSPEILKWFKDRNTVDGGILPEIVVYPNNNPVQRGIVPVSEWMKLPKFRGGKDGDVSLEDVSTEYYFTKNPVLKWLDPTGVSSYPDVYDGYKNGSNTYDQFMNILQSVPMIGKVAKIVNSVGNIGGAWKDLKEYWDVKNIYENQIMIDPETNRMGHRGNVGSSQPYGNHGRAVLATPLLAEWYRAMSDGEHNVTLDYSRTKGMRFDGSEPEWMLVPSKLK